MKNSIAQRSADASGRSNLMQGDVLHIVFVHVVHHDLEGVVVYIPVDEIIPVEISAFIDPVHNELPDLKEGFGDLKFIPQSLSLKKKHKFLHFCCVPVSVSEMEKRDFFIAIMNAAAATCFWILHSGYVMIVMFRFKDYAKYPVSIFDGIFKAVFTFVIPIAFIAYYPGLVILRPSSIPLLSKLAPVIGIFFFWLSYKFWMLGARKYEGTGS